MLGTLTEGVRTDMRVNDIHDEISRLFKQYKYPWLTLRLPMANLHSWGKYHAQRLGIEEDAFTKCVATIFWAVSHVQLGLGYALIARQSVSFPRGKKGSAYRINDIPNVLGIPDMHFWYHAYMTIECIYRCWERLTRLLQVACFPDCSEKLYFGDLVNRIKNDSRFKNNRALHNIESQLKHWNRVANDRNKLSHRDSSPMHELEFVGDVSRIRGPSEQIIFKIDYSYSDIRQEIEKLKGYYVGLVPAIEAVQKFIENIE